MNKRLLSDPMKQAKRILKVVTNNLQPFGTTGGRLRYLYTGNSKEHEAISKILAKDREAQDAKTLKAVGEYLETKCPHDVRFPKADCSLCVWELVGVLKQGRMPE